jgi:hypothetical protein
MTETISEIIASQDQTAIVPGNSLVKIAMDKGFDLDRLQQVIDMQERQEAKAAEREYVDAMNRCQEKMPIIVRDKENQLTKSSYARLETVAAAIRPVYTSEGFTLEFSEGVSPLPNHRRVLCQVQHRGGHKKEFHLDSPIDDVGAQGKANKTAIQGLGSMISYLRRYLTLMIFNIVVADEDNDGNGAKNTISDEAVSTLNGMIASCRDAGKPIDHERFLRAVGVQPGGDLGDIPQNKFLVAVELLTKKLSARKADAVTA